MVISAEAPSGLMATPQGSLVSLKFTKPKLGEVLSAQNVLNPIAVHPLLRSGIAAQVPSGEYATSLSVVATQGSEMLRVTVLLTRSTTAMPLTPPTPLVTSVASASTPSGATAIPVGWLATPVLMDASTAWVSSE